MIDLQLWQKQEHVKTFDAWSRLTDRELKILFESFNEIRLLKDHYQDVKGSTFFEVGCATGELYRYLNQEFSSFHYCGFDVSEATILRAQEKYPGGKFFVSSSGLENILTQFEKPSIVFSRDVIHHQLKPYEFLNTLISLAKEALILRIRKLDKGESILDSEQSCQWHYGGWVPYMILNVDEVIGTILKKKKVKSIYILKHYQILGGKNGRFLPKSCYDPKTGMAETALFIQFSEVEEKPKIVIEARKDSVPDYSLFQRGWHFVKNKLML